METVLRIKQKINSEKLTVSAPEIRKLQGKEVEILIIFKDSLDEESVPTKAVQNSTHIAGSLVLDQEAMREMLESRFR
jgi:hypothetical protein